MLLDEIRDHPNTCLAIVLTAWQAQINLINQGDKRASCLPVELCIDTAVEQLLEGNYNDTKDLLDSFSELNDYIRNQIYTLPF